MKLSVSLSDDDVAILDAYAASAGLKSRSAAVQQAIHALVAPNLEDSYDQAWQEWTESGDADAWEATAADGLT